MKRILDSTNKICLFCGQLQKEYYDEGYKYYECDCKDTIETRRIENEIDELEKKLPQRKYEVRNERVLYKIKN